MLRTYRTPKGTELPLLNLRGREYLEVKYRLVWFREDHPDWAIETELLSVTESSANARATIKDEKGRVIATSHKFETAKGFPDFIEKAETGAIGRALALIGYGTQFCADELDEGDRIVDAPVENRGGRQERRPDKMQPQQERRPERVEASAQPEPRAAAGQQSQQNQKSQTSQPIPKDPGDYEIGFGKKYKGVKLRDIPRGELEGYIEWLEDNASKKGLPLSEDARFLKVAIGRFFGTEGAGAKGGRPAQSTTGGRSASRDRH